MFYGNINNSWVHDPQAEGGAAASCALALRVPLRRAAGRPGLQTRYAQTGRPGHPRPAPRRRGVRKIGGVPTLGLLDRKSFEAANRQRCCQETLKRLENSVRAERGKTLQTDAADSVEYAYGNNSL